MADLGLHHGGPATDTWLQAGGAASPPPLFGGPQAMAAWSERAEARRAAVLAQVQLPPRAPTAAVAPWPTAAPAPAALLASAAAPTLAAYPLGGDVLFNATRPDVAVGSNPDAVPAPKKEGMFFLRATPLLGPQLVPGASAQCLSTTNAEGMLLFTGQVDIERVPAVGRGMAGYLSRTARTQQRPRIKEHRTRSAVDKCQGFLLRGMDQAEPGVAMDGEAMQGQVRSIMSYVID